MFGGGFGFLVCLVTSLCGATSWWWLLWGSLIGGAMEFFTRLGCGEAVGDIIESTVDIISSVGDAIGSDGGSSGDSGGCDSGSFSDSGGGGDW